MGVRVGGSVTTMKKVLKGKGLRLLLGTPATRAGYSLEKKCLQTARILVAR